MNITIRIRQIGNGVLVSSDDYLNKLSCEEHGHGGELHFPSLEAMLVDLPDIAKNAWEAAERHKREWSQARAAGNRAQAAYSGDNLHDEAAMTTAAFGPPVRIAGSETLAPEGC